MKKFKNFAKVLLFIFIVNFIPVNAYVWGSKFGIENVGITELENGERNVYVQFYENFSSEIKEVKLHTKVYNYEYDYYTNEDKSTVVNGPILNLNTKKDNQFIGTLKEEQITLDLCQYFGQKFRFFWWVPATLDKPFINALKFSPEGDKLKASYNISPS